jgi:hypothetical protein
MNRPIRRSPCLRRRLGCIQRSVLVGQHAKYDDPDDPEFYERQQRFGDAEHELLVLVRQALSTHEGDLSLPVPAAAPGLPGRGSPALVWPQGRVSGSVP